MDSGQETRILIATPARKRVAFSACILPVVFYIVLAAAHFQATRLAAVPALASLEWASRLDPWNDQYRAWIGEYYLLVPQKPATAVAFIHSAIQLNPQASRYWLDLAAADQLLGKRREQLAALAHALAIDPKTPATAWEAANAYLTLGETDSALASFRTVMEGSPSLQPAALQYCWRLKPDAQALLRDILPMNGAAPVALLELLMSKNESAAATAWAKLVQIQHPLEPKDVFNYLQYLIHQRDFAAIKQAWSDGAKLAGLADYQPSAANLIVNGNFQLPILNAGLDWRYQQSPDVMLALDPAVSHSGRGSLQLAFDSLGMGDAGIRQIVPVAADTQYGFSAFFKTEQLQGAGGLRFVIEDFVSGATYFETEDLVSDEVWRQSTGEFTTGPGAQLVTLRIQRVPAGDALRGKLWIDNVRLVQESRVAEAQP